MLLKSFILIQTSLFVFHTSQKHKIKALILEIHPYGSKTIALAVSSLFPHLFSSETIHFLSHLQPFLYCLSSFSSFFFIFLTVRRFSLHSFQYFISFNIQHLCGCLSFRLTGKKNEEMKNKGMDLLGTLRYETLFLESN